MAAARPKRASERGMALISVLWILVLIGLVAASASLTARFSTLDMRAAQAAAQARWLADAGIERGLYDLLAGAEDRTLDLTGTPATFRFTQGTVTVRIMDETGKVDLNAAPREVLAALFAGLALDDETGRPLDPETIADTILDWRDRNDEPRVFGAEAARYRAGGLPQLPANGPFTSLLELANLYGLSPRLADRLTPYLTTASRSRAINPAHAPADVLYALPGVSAAEVDRLIAARAAGAPLPRLSGAALFLTDRVGPGFLIEATARLPDGVRFRRQALVWIEGFGIDTPIPYVLERRPGFWLDTDQ